MLGIGSGAALLALSLVLTGCVSTHAGAAPTASKAPIPAPGGGTIDQVVPSPTPTGTPTHTTIGQAAVVDGAVSISLATVKSTSVKATTPGETSGTAVVVTVDVTNKGTSAADVDSAWVQLTASDGTLGIPTTAGNPHPLSGTVAPGATSTGSYVFMLPKAKGRTVTVSVIHSAAAPAAIFKGRVS